jgi:hypothetical protein
VAINKQKRRADRGNWPSGPIGLPPARERGASIDGRGGRIELSLHARSVQSLSMDNEQRRRLADRFTGALRRRDRMEKGRQYRQRDVDASIQLFVRGISKTKAMWIAAVVLALVMVAIL